MLHGMLCMAKRAVVALGTLAGGVLSAVHEARAAGWQRLKGSA